MMKTLQDILNEASIYQPMESIGNASLQDENGNTCLHHMAPNLMRKLSNLEPGSEVYEKEIKHFLSMVNETNKNLCNNNNGTAAHALFVPGPWSVIFSNTLYILL